MADPNQLSRQERRLVDQIHPAKLATEQRLIPRRTGRLGYADAMSRAMPCRSVANSASWASPAFRLSRSAWPASVVRRLPSGRITQFIRCLAVVARVVTWPSVSPLWTK
jgi:hypothetical protein